MENRYDISIDNPDHAVEKVLRKQHERLKENILPARMGRSSVGCL